MLPASVQHIVLICNLRKSLCLSSLSAILPTMFSQQKNKNIFGGLLGCFFIQETMSEGFIDLLG